MLAMLTMPGMSLKLYLILTLWDLQISVTSLSTVVRNETVRFASQEAIISLNICFLALQTKAQNQQSRDKEK